MATCGGMTKKGTPCQNKAGSCPHHGGGSAPSAVGLGAVSPSFGSPPEASRKRISRRDDSKRWDRSARRTTASGSGAPGRAGSPKARTSPNQRHHHGASLNSRPPGNLRRQKRVTRNKDILASRARETISSGVVSLIFDPNSRYRMVADQLLDQLPWYRRWTRSHWLCAAVNDTCKVITPSTYSNYLGNNLTELMVEAEMPRFAAEIIGKSTAFSAARLMDAAGHSQLIAGLRALIVLVCPNLDRCPAQKDVCTALVAPGVEDALRGRCPS